MQWGVGVGNKIFQSAFIKSESAFLVRRHPFFEISFCSGPASINQSKKTLAGKS